MGKLGFLNRGPSSDDYGKRLNSVPSFADRAFARRRTPCSKRKRCACMKRICRTRKQTALGGRRACWTTGDKRAHTISATYLDLAP